VYFHELLVVVWEINHSDMPRLAYFHYDVTVCVKYCASLLAGPHWVLTFLGPDEKNGSFSNILFLHKNLLEYIANKVIEL